MLCIRYTSNKLVTELDSQGKYILESQLEQAGYDPWAKPVATKEYAQTMMEKVAILKNQRDLAGGRGKIAGFTNADSYHGATNVKTGDIYLARNSLSTASNMSLGTVIFHELKHLVFYWNSGFQKLLKYSGQKRSDYEHFLIHKEIGTVLLNSRFTFGTGDALKSLNQKYGWQYK
ncbi:hypothetical protein J2810_000307 [Chryseobacterium rhizosphaerae]|uniref:hypothetical protein n=1 Tax=Chryseobacterium rhizosphaerae TaxID=395937 RepID=UPI00286377CB|nr:hypothetical protein [Chryseobacterium rhizosphaerae]MDR6544285.1 hypothetical protein [Chryseobacterium rhizosphaerae]